MNVPTPVGAKQAPPKRGRLKQFEDPGGGTMLWRHKIADEQCGKLWVPNECVEKLGGPVEEQVNA